MKLFLCFLLFCTPLYAGVTQGVYGTTDASSDTTLSLSTDLWKGIQLFSYGDLTKNSIYTEHHLSFMPWEFLGVEANGNVATGEDALQFGIRSEPLVSLLPEWMTYSLTVYPGTVNGVPGYQFQVEHWASVKYAPVKLTAFLDHTLSSHSDASNLVAEIELSFSLVGPLSLLGEYRFHEGQDPQHEAAFGMGMVYF